MTKLQVMQDKSNSRKPAASECKVLKWQDLLRSQLVERDRGLEERILYTEMGTRQDAPLFNF
jgi:hypothetical protein